MPTPLSTKPGVWRVLALAITVLSLAWVFWLLVRAWPTLAARIGDVAALPMLAGLACSVGSAFTMFIVFARLARLLKVGNMPWQRLAHIYFVGQLLKHLPGRVWGIGYQWSAGAPDPQNSFGRWVMTNVAHMLLATYFALWGATLVLLAADHMVWATVALALGTVLFAAAWAAPAVLRIPERLARWLPRATGLSHLELMARATTLQRAQVFAICMVAICLNYAAWGLYGASYPPVGPMAGIQLCAYYMIAWFVGYATLVTPSGVGVRELTFVWLAHNYPADAIALMAVLGRSSLLLVDVILGAAFAPFAAARR